MPNKTTNYNMTKPLGNETVDINQLNENFDIIDTQLFENKESVDELNSNLSQLEFDEVAGGKNLFNKNYVYDGYPDSTTGLPNGSTTYGQVTSGEIKVKPNGKYIKNGSNNANFPHSFFDENHNFISREETSSFITVPSNAHYIRVCLSKSTIDTFQFEEGTQSTDYEPYIPSVKMLAEDVKAQNDSLDDYGLGNKFDGNLRQGYFNDNAVWTNETSDVTSNSLFTCKAGDVVTVKASKESNIYIKFFDSSNNMLQKANSTQTKEFTQKAPTNAVKFAFSLSYSNIKPSDFSHVGIYINNSIDEIKNDLIILEASTQVVMTSGREFDDKTDAITIPSGYEPIAMYGYNSRNNDNISVTPLHICSDGRVLYHAKNHSESDQGTMRMVVRITFKKMS